MSDRVEAAEQVMTMFASLLPSSNMEEPASKKHKSSVSPQPRDTAASSSAMGKAKDNEKEKEKKGKKGKKPSMTVESLSLNLARLAIRTEDHINRQRLDTAFMIHFPTTAKILPSMLAISHRWKELREKGNIHQDFPLRTVLLRCLMEELNKSLSPLDVSQESDRLVSLSLEGVWCARPRGSVCSASVGSGARAASSGQAALIDRRCQGNDHNTSTPPSRSRDSASVPQLQTNGRRIQRSTPGILSGDMASSSKLRSSVCMPATTLRYECDGSHRVQAAEAGAEAISVHLHSGMKGTTATTSQSQLR